MKFFSARTITFNQNCQDYIYIGGSVSLLDRFLGFSLTCGHPFSVDLPLDLFRVCCLFSKQHLYFKISVMTGQTKSFSRKDLNNTYFILDVILDGNYNINQSTLTLLSVSFSCSKLFIYHHLTTRLSLHAMLFIDWTQFHDIHTDESTNSQAPTLRMFNQAPGLQGRSVLLFPF